MAARDRICECSLLISIDEFLARPTRASSDHAREPALRALDASLPRVLSQAGKKREPRVDRSV
jgi:hypothetical protein